MPDIPTARLRVAVACISFYGFLVIGGTNKENLSGMVETELLLEIPQMRGFTTIGTVFLLCFTYTLYDSVFIDESVFVTEAKSFNVNFQMFRYVYEADGQ